MIPMRVRLFALLVVASAGWMAWAADPAPIIDKGDSKSTSKVWQDDPVCQMVFFAVLEGLYTDGVPNEVVELIVSPKPKEGENPVAKSFIIQCPLCHPVFEAFTLYQQRQPFADDKLSRDTFGKGIDPEIVKLLKSDQLKIRLSGLRQLVRTWVERRMTMMRLTESERTDWIAKLEARSNEGVQQFRNLRATDPRYKTWNFYGG